MDIKGTALASIPEFVMNKFGKKGFDEWLNSLSAEARDVYRYPINQTQWFPLIKMLSEPTDVICKMFYSGSKKGAWEGGRFSAEIALHGIYKLFVKLGSVESLIKRASVILPTYYKPSSIRVADAKDKRVVLSIDKFPEMDAIIESRIAGWMERAVEISGQKNVKVDITKSLASGDSSTEFIITWE